MEEDGFSSLLFHFLLSCEKKIILLSASYVLAAWSYQNGAFYVRCDKPDFATIWLRQFYSMHPKFRKTNDFAAFARTLNSPDSRSR